MNIDAEWSYRWLAPRLVKGVGTAVARIDTAIRVAVVGGVRGAIAGAARGHGPKGVLARTWPTGSMILWVAVLLGAYLVFYL